MVSTSQFNNPGGQMIPSSVNLPPRYPTQLDGGQGMVQQQGSPCNWLPSGICVMGGPGMHQQQQLIHSHLRQCREAGPILTGSGSGYRFWLWITTIL